MKTNTVLAIGINLPQEEKITIQKNLKSDHITLDTASIKDIMLTVINGKIEVRIKGKDLKTYDYVWIQSGWNTTHMAYLLHLYLKLHKIPHNKTNTYNTKLSDIFFLASNNISVPNTFFFNGLKIDEKDISQIGDICKFPCIFKTSLGSFGSNVFLINAECEIKDTILDKKKYNRYIFQQYIPNDFDYRIVIANKKPTSACIRTRLTDKYRNNVALGAKEDFIDINKIPKEVLDIAVASTKALKLNWAGVDLVTDKDTGQHYVLEVNRRPGLTKKSSEIKAFYEHVKELVGK